MKNSNFVFLVSVVFSLSWLGPVTSWAHGDHGEEPTLEELEVQGQTLFNRLEKDVFLSATEAKQIGPADLGAFVYGGQSLAFRKSAMSAAVADILQWQMSVEKLQCSKNCVTCGCQASSQQIEKKKKRIQDRILNFVKAPYEIIEPFIEDPLGASLGPSVRLTKEYGVGLFFVIVVTQAAWETVESVASFSMGAGGAHLYCVVFNMALLAVVDSANSFGSMMCQTASGLNLKERLSFATQSFWRSLTWGRSLAKNYLVNRGFTKLVTHLGDFRKHNSLSKSTLWQTALSSGFFASGFVAKSGQASVFSDVDVLSDVPFIYGTASREERFVVAHQHIMGFGLLFNFVKNYLSAKREQNLIALEPFLAAQSALGTWARRKNDYAALLKLAAFTEGPVAAEARVQIMQKTAREMMLELEALFTEIRGDRPQFDDHAWFMEHRRQQLKRDLKELSNCQRAFVK